MKQYELIPDIDDASAPEFDGHLWLLEAVEGSLLRFQLLDSGRIRFGDERRVYDGIDDASDQYRRAIRHVQERLDREALRSAVDDVEGLTFVGRASHLVRIDYEWEHLPPFLGLDVWEDDTDEGDTSGSFRPPDAVESIYDRLGLAPINAVDREVNSRDFDAGSYQLPESAWYDGPAAGVVARDKRGGRARLSNPSVPDDGRAPIDADDAESLAEAVATQRRFERVAGRLRARGWELTVEVLRERVLDDVFREEHGRLFAGERTVDRSAFRGAVGSRAQRFLGE